MREERFSEKVLKKTIGWKALKLIKTKTQIGSSMEQKWTGNWTKLIEFETKFSANGTRMNKIDWNWNDNEQNLLEMEQEWIKLIETGTKMIKIETKTSENGKLMNWPLEWINLTY